VNDEIAGFPTLRDEGGYPVQPRDAAFVGVTRDNLRAMADHASPLGFPAHEDWHRCMAELRTALERDGLLDADIRLKGTAASFFSHNPNKHFPRSGADCRAQADANGLDGAEAEALWNRSPCADATTLPTRAFWDSRHMLGIDSERSDYDVQLSSETLVETLRAQYPDGNHRGRPVISTHGGHYTHVVLLRTFPALAAWSERWQATLGRQVNLAGFPAGGPSNEISRFKDEDWVIIA
jgi:hypothetical protein